MNISFHHRLICTTYIGHPEMYWRKKSNDHPYRYSLDAARREGCNMTYGPSSLSPWICNASKENEKLLAFRIALVFVGRWDTVAAVEKE